MEWRQQQPCIHFCEPAYVHSKHVAEMSNTLSSLSYVLVGLWCARALHAVRDRCGVRLWMAWNVVCVGVGSALFHATQRFDAELLDEISMLTLMLLWLYDNVNKHPWVRRCQHVQTIIPLVFLYLVAIVLCTTHRYIESRDHSWFVCTFAGLLSVNVMCDLHDR